MAARITGYARRNAIALVALFVALGGTSYAVSSGGFAHPGGELVGCAKISSGSLRLIRPGTGCRASELTVSWAEQGRTGPRGVQGPKGDKGTNGVSVTSAILAAGDPSCATGGSKFTTSNGITFACNGSKGDRGPVGPTLAAQAGGETPATPGGFLSNVSFLSESKTTITTPTAGSLMVFGRLPDVALTCNQSYANCTAQVGLYVDGVPVPGSKQFLILYNSCSGCSASAVEDPAREPVNLFGLVTGLAPGAHTVQIGWDGLEVDNGCQAACTNNSTVVDYGPSQTAAILLGN